MNKEDLMKKLELARVGNGTQTYNDVVLTLTKEETLELLKYIEKFEKLEKLVWKKVEEIINEEHRPKELYDKNIDLKQENQELKDKVKELEFLNENLNKYIDNFRQNANIQKLYDNQKIYKMKKAIKILKEYIMYEELDEILEKYPDLKEVLESDR